MIIDDIAAMTGLNPAFLHVMGNTASYRYKTYTIPKRTGGTRTIHHPAKTLKFIQRWIVSHLLVNLPIHDAVYSYRKGINIAKHAGIHANKNYLLRIDFQNFFPSLTAHDVERLLVTRLPKLHPKDVSYIVSIVCRSGVLTIGAPSSPILSNAILYEFDQHWFEYCNDHNAQYSRYADDVYISTDKPNILYKIYSEIESYLELLDSPRLTLNEEKTIYTSRKRRRAVTGVTLTSDRKISLGRKKKREIKTLIHLHTVDRLDPERKLYLQGYLSFASDIEPSFIVSLRNKFSHEVLQQIMGVGHLATNT